MIVYADMSPDYVTSYHTESHITDLAVKMAGIKGTKEYSDLKADIETNGIKDALVAMSTPTRICMIEVGEQRLLIARELGLSTIPVVCYLRNRTIVPFAYKEVINSLEKLESYFTDKEALGLVMLKQYLPAGICNFDPL